MAKPEWHGHPARVKSWPRWPCHKNWTPPPRLRGDKLRENDPCAERDRIPNDTTPNDTTTHGRQVDIAEDQIHASFLQSRQGFGAIAGLEDFRHHQPRLADRTADNLPHYGRVVHNQCAQRVHVRASNSRKGFFGIPPPNTPAAPKSIN